MSRHGHFKDSYKVLVHSNRLIKRIVSQNVLVVLKSSRNRLLKLDILVSDPVVVVVDCPEDGLNLRGSVVPEEHLPLTGADRWQAIIIIRQVVGTHRFAHPERPGKRNHDPVGDSIEAVYSVRQDLPSIEDWHALSASETADCILMGVHYCIDASLSQFGYESINLVKISLIVVARTRLNCFPHHPKPD